MQPFTGRTASSNLPENGARVRPVQVQIATALPFAAWRRRPEENRRGARGARERGEMFHVRSPLFAALFAHGSPAPCVPCVLAVLSASILPAPFGSSILARTAPESA